MDPGQSIGKKNLQKDSQFWVLLRTFVTHGKRSKNQQELDIPILEDFEGLKTSVEEITADVVKIGNQVEPEEVIWVAAASRTTWMDEEVFLFSEQRDWFLEMECTLGGDAINIINNRILILHKFSCWSSRV